MYREARKKISFFKGKKINHKRRYASKMEVFLMNLVKRLKQFAIITLITWISLTIVGCTQTNSALTNPVAAKPDDPQTAIKIGGTSSDTGKSVNKAPVINLSLTKTSVGTGAELSLNAQALDPDGDKLTFAWSSSEGVFISNSGNNVVWKAPDTPMLASITCLVSDSKGAKTSAKAMVEVVGNTLYRLVVTANRDSLVAGSIAKNNNNMYTPLPGARVELVDSGEVGVTDSSGVVEFNINQTNKVATSTLVNVKCFDWEISYEATLKPLNGNKVLDSINFYPGFDGVTVAVAKGDSFAIKRGAVEVSTIENVYGERKPVPEVTVDIGSAQGMSSVKSGMALIPSPSVGNGEINLRLKKTGYQTIDGYKIPVSPDGVTLVKAQIEKANFTPNSVAILSWTKPYRSQKSFPVNGPFELGFGQPMEKESIFDDIALVIQNKKTGTVMTLDGASIKKHFRVNWIGSTILQLFPIRPLTPMTKYSMLIREWVAHTADGRILKNYNGMYGEFYTDSDPEPSIVSTTPVNGDENIGRSGPFVVNFDRPIKTSSLLDNLKIEITNLKTGSKVSIDGTSLETYFSITWKNQNTTLELVPYRMLQANNTYLIKVLSCNLKSETGKAVKDISNIWGQFKTSGL